MLQALLAGEITIRQPHARKSLLQHPGCKLSVTRPDTGIASTLASPISSRVSHVPGAHRSVLKATSFPSGLRVAQNQSLTCSIGSVASTLVPLPVESI
jgi:hypothetical protein